MASTNGEDLAAAVHETTNALTVILGWIERARAATAEAHPEARAALDRAERYARQARDGMREAIGARVERPTSEPAGELSRRILEDLEVEARRADVALTLFVLPGAEAALVADPRGAWQVLTNLLLNAIAMSPPHSEVKLSAAECGSMVRFEVRDHGPGVPLSRRPSLFDGGSSDRPGGAGIGLRHARALAEAAGGSLELDDETDRGACFLLGWPRAAGDATPARPAPGAGRAPLSLAGAKVLLLEDDAAVVELLELALGAKGAAVTTVRDARALDRTLEGGPFDLLLVDLSPLTTQRGGVVTEDQGLAQALDKARRHNPSIGVIVISGSVTVQPRDDIVWVRKPFEPRELVEAIARHQRRSR